MAPLLVLFDRPNQCRLAPTWLTMAVAGAGLLVSPVLAAPSYTTVNLQSRANHRLAEDIRMETPGNNLASLPQGELKTEGVTFQVGEKMLLLRSKVLMDRPDRIEGVKVDAVGDRIHALHGTVYGDGRNLVDAGTPVGAYVLHYEDGTTARLPLIYGEEIRDWWEQPNMPPAKKAKIVWTGTNPYSQSFDMKIRLFAMVWDNPKPEKKIASLSFESAATNCSPFLVGLTLEKK